MSQAMPEAGQDQTPDSDATDGGKAQQTPASPNPISSGHFRRAAGQFVTGVTIVTTRLEGVPRGMTANSFTTVSLDPPLILWNVGKASDSYRAFTQCDAFAVHVLSRQQEQLARLFATRGADRFEGLEFSEGLSGIPLLNDCLTIFECRVAYHHPGGDHTIVVGEVLRLHEGPSREPLVFHAGRFVGPEPQKNDTKTTRQAP